MKITNNTTSSGVFSQQPPVRLAEIPRKCANCHRIFGDEVEYGGKSPTDGVVLCADCFDFAKGNNIIAVKVKLDDGSIWDGYLTDENTVIIYPTDEYLEYYEFKYSGGNEFPEPVNNEYEIEDVEILSA